MSLLDFLHVCSCSFAASLWVAMVICMVSPHPVPWLTVSTVCIAVLATCVAAVLCVLSRRPSHSCGGSRKKDDSTHMAYEAVDDEADAAMGGSIPYIP